MKSCCPRHSNQCCGEPPTQQTCKPEPNFPPQIQSPCCVRNSQQVLPQNGACDCSLVQNNNQMEVLQLQPETKTIVLKKVDIPCPDCEDVIIKVAYAGVCGTDLHIIEGTFPASKDPFTLGHEISGTVHKVGDAVTHVKVGDHVGVDPNSSCGLCKYCRTAAYHMCPNGALNSTLGIFRDGGWAQYCKVPAKQVYKLPDKVKLCQGALLEPLSCVAHAMTRIYPLPVGSSILILGAGIAGNLMSCILHHLGHRNVFIIEPQPVRQNLAKELLKGACMEQFQVLHPSEIANGVKEDGIDLCIDCSGNKEAMETALQFMNPGGKICIYGVASPETTISVSPFQMFLKELSIFGTTINRFSYYYAISLMEAMGTRYIHHEKLGIKFFRLCEYQEALDTLKKGAISKAVFKMETD